MPSKHIPVIVLELGAYLLKIVLASTTELVWPVASTTRVTYAKNATTAADVMVVVVVVSTAGGRNKATTCMMPWLVDQKVQCLALLHICSCMPIVAPAKRVIVVASTIPHARTFGRRNFLRADTIRILLIPAIPVVLVIRNLVCMCIFIIIIYI